MISVEMFKVLDPKTGKFSKGGCAPAQGSGQWGWSKKGKVWTSAGGLRSHLGLFVHSNWRGNDKGWEYSLHIPIHWVVVRTFSEDGILKQEEINAVDFYLQSKDTNYAKSLRKQDKQR